MANHKSSVKRARQTIKRTVRNRSVETGVKGSIRKFREAIAAGDKSQAEAAFKTATRVIRKAASKGVLHARTASRRVSRLTQAFSRMG